MSIFCNRENEWQEVPLGYGGVIVTEAERLARRGPDGQPQVYLRGREYAITTETAKELADTPYAKWVGPPPAPNVVERHRVVVKPMQAWQTADRELREALERQAKEIEALKAAVETKAERSA